MAERPADGAAIVIIGSEILSAKVQDDNSRYLTDELRALGVPVRRILVVEDDVEEIAWAVNEARQIASTVFTTGGIGPTHDDLTVAGVARALNRAVRRHPLLEAGIRSYLETKGRTEEIDSALKMAEVPEGAELVAGSGQSFPVACIENVYMFPGIPSVLKDKWKGIRDRFRQTPFHLAEIYLTPEEHRIARCLYAFKEQFPEILLGSYPELDRTDYRVKLTLESKDLDYLQTAFASLLDTLDPELVVRVSHPQ